MICSKCRTFFSLTHEFVHHVDQSHGASTLNFGKERYERDSTDYLFHCNFPGCRQALVHRQDFQNHIRRRHQSGKENKAPQLGLPVRMPCRGQLLRQCSSPYSIATGNPATKNPLDVFASSSALAERDPSSDATMEVDIFTTVSGKGNMAWKDPLTFFFIFSSS
jgi:hypothetical protein